jgi:DNA-binding HxlR family transcriptional regulator
VRWRARSRTLDVIGEPWSPLILRDVWAGLTRFEQIQADLGVSPKVLAERLNHLVGHGVLERRPYDRRPRYEYVLTDRGTELVDVLEVMVGWADHSLGRQALRSATVTTPAARLATSTCAARAAESRCMPATST